MVRFIKKIYPDEINEYFTEEQLFTYTLPQNIIDLHSISKYFTGNVDPVEKYNDGTYLKRFLPTNSSSIIDEIQIKRDGEIVQIIPEYALLHQMYSDTDDNHFPNTEGEKTNTLFTNEINTSNIETKAPDFYNTSVLSKYKYSITKWLGFLNAKSRYLDCRNKHVQITFKLSPKTIAYRGLKVMNTSSTVDNTVDYSNWHYYIRDCFMNMVVVDNENVDIDNEVYFNDFSHFKSQANIRNKNTVVKGRVDKNIKHLIGTFTDLNRNTDTGLQLHHVNEDITTFGAKLKDKLTGTTIASLRTELNKNHPIIKELYTPELATILHKQNTLNNSIYFKRNGIDTKTNQFKVNGIAISPPFTALESFNNVKNTFNTQLKKVHNLASFINNFFMNAIYYNSEDDEVSFVEWDIVSEGKNVGGYAHLFVVHNKSVKF